MLGEALGELVTQAKDLFTELINDLGVVRYMEFDVKHVALHHCLDLLRSIRILQSVQRILVGCERWGDVGDHDRPTVTAQGVFKEPGQLGVSIRDMLLLLLCRVHLSQLTQGVYTVAKSQ